MFLTALWNLVEHHRACEVGTDALVINLIACLAKITDSTSIWKSTPCCQNFSEVLVSTALLTSRATFFYFKRQAIWEKYDSDSGFSTVR